MRSLFIALLIAFPAVVFAQTNYQPGYIVQNSGDTVKGFINYQEWRYSPSAVAFKVNLSDAIPQQISPGMVKGFGIPGGERYASFIGPMTINRNIFPDIPSRLDTTRRPASIFMKQLTTGDHLTLYLYTDVGKNKFFIAEKQGPVSELRYYEYYGPAHTDEVTDNLFRGQLNLYIYKYNNGDEKLLAAMADVKYEVQDLEDAVNRLNSVVVNGKTERTDRDHPKSKIRFFAGAGVSPITNSYTYSGTSITTSNNVTSVNTVSGESISHSVMLNLDGGVDFMINPDIQQFIFRAELSVATFGEHAQQPATTDFAAFNFSYTGIYVSVVPQLIYNVYNTNKFKVYIDGGFGLHAVSYSNGGGNYSISNGYGTGFYVPVQAGVVINKKFEISVQYSGFTSAATYSTVTVSNKVSANIGVKYLFN